MIKNISFKDKDEAMVFLREACNGRLKLGGTEHGSELYQVSPVAIVIVRNVGLVTFFINETYEDICEYLENFNIAVDELLDERGIYYLKEETDV